MEKIALVTGSSSGIGKEIAKVLLQNGYFLILSGRNEKGFDDFQNNPQVSIIVGDITKEETRSALVKRVKKKGRLDLLVNNAGITFIQSFEEDTPEQLETMLSTNLKAPILLTHSLYSLMRSQNSGTIVFMNSAAGKQGYAGHTLYSTAKFGLNGFAQSLRLEAKKYGIRVISIHPGGVKTNLYNNVKEKPNVEEYMDAKKLASLVVALCEIEGLSPDEVSISRMTKS